MDHEIEPKATVEHTSNQSSSTQIAVVEGVAKGARFKISGNAIIGRSPDASVLIEDAGVSRLHARITRTESGTFVIEDLGSRNGTFVNGKRITRHVLAFGDKIRLGPQTAFELHGFDPVEDYIVQRQHFEALGRLSVGIAHDLNNVLATFEAATAYLSKLPPTSQLGESDAVECIADLTLAAKRASELTRSIVTFARGTGSRRSSVDLTALVAEVARMLHHAFDSNIRIEIAAQPNVLVHGSKSELHQVLLNLCFNSRDAMRFGGVLRIETSIEQSPPAELEWRPGQAAAVLSVVDTGTGMDSVTQARVFDLFFTTKREGHGYGLGLATVREIVSQHDGKIALQSAPDQGSKFTIRLPLVRQDEVESSNVEESREVPTTLVPPGIISIMLVDDDPVVRRAIARRLRQAGLDVDEAVNGLEALSLYTKRDYDLIVLDFDMPELDGLETQARLMDVDPSVRIVFVTGYADPERVAKARSAGALGLLEKPYRVGDLLEFTQKKFPSERPTRLEN
jgi:two-component system, cell cycle sensor histidine kinase and response regulator CckA